MTVNDLNHIQIFFDLTVIRIYYVEKMFYSCLVNHEAITPKMFKKAHKARDYLNEKLKDKTNIDFRFFYRTDTKMEKKIQINECSGWYSDSDNIEKLIHRALLLLID